MTMRSGRRYGKGGLVPASSEGITIKRALPSQSCGKRNTVNSAGRSNGASIGSTITAG